MAGGFIRRVPYPPAGSDTGCEIRPKRLIKKSFQTVRQHAACNMREKV